MHVYKRLSVLALLIHCFCSFAPDLIPSIDTNTHDWDIVGEAYVIGMEHLFDNRIDNERHLKADSQNLDVKVETRYNKAIEARWSFSVTDMSRRIVAFRNESVGVITRWNRDFGDGAVSSEQNPSHSYSKPGQYVATQWVEVPSGRSRLAKVWDVAVK